MVAGFRRSVDRRPFVTGRRMAAAGGSEGALACASARDDDALLRAAATAPLGIPMRPTLFCLEGSLRGCTLAPEGDPLILGSDPDCEIRFPPSESHPLAPRHARIHKENGCF